MLQMNVLWLVQKFAQHAIAASNHGLDADDDGDHADDDFEGIARGSTGADSEGVGEDEEADSVRSGKSKNRYAPHTKSTDDHILVNSSKACDRNCCTRGLFFEKSSQTVLVV